MNGIELTLDRDINGGLDVIIETSEVDFNVSNETTVGLELQESGGGFGTSNYEQLKNKPSINKVELTGDKSSEQLGLLGEERAIEIEEIMAICQ